MGCSIDPSFHRSIEIAFIVHIPHLPNPETSTE
jgi:hypothetical protein